MLKANDLRTHPDHLRTSDVDIEHERDVETKNFDEESLDDGEHSDHDHQRDNDVNDGNESGHENPFMSKELMEREKAFREKNRILKTKTAKIFQNVEKVVNQGLHTLAAEPLKRPNSVVQVNIIDEERNRSHTSHSMRTKKNPKPSSAVAGGFKRPSSAFSNLSSAPNSSLNTRAVGSKIADVVQSSVSNRSRTPATKHAAHEDEGISYEEPEDDGMAMMINGMDEGMGSDATERFLRAKVLVLTDELNKLMGDLKEKEVSMNDALQRAKLAEEERSKTVKLHLVLRKDHDKTSAQNELLTQKNESLKAELSSVRKEMDNLSRNRKQTESDSSAREVRINRALEESDRCKSVAAKAQQEARDMQETSRIKVERTVGECKRLEKQKQELMVAFRKQAQLIDVLKRQKSHIEAAKLLEFTEAEFISTLDWKI